MIDAKLVREVTVRLENHLVPGRSSGRPLHDAVERELRSVWDAAYKQGRKDERLAREGEQ